VAEKGLLGSAAPETPESRSYLCAAESSKPRGELNRNVMSSLLPTTGKAAPLCSVKPDTVLKWIKKGVLPATRSARGRWGFASTTGQIYATIEEPFNADEIVALVNRVPVETLESEPAEARA
jgi:hypothetical protein